VPTRTPRRVTTRALRRPLVALVASSAVATLGQTSEAAPQQATITVLPGIVQPGKKIANADGQDGSATRPRSKLPATRSEIRHIRQGTDQRSA